MSDPLQKPLAATTLRIRAQRAADATGVMTLAGLGLAGFVLALLKVDALAEDSAKLWFVGAAALPIVGALVGLLRPVPPLLAAKLLDRSHDLSDRVSNAVSFTALSERTAFMDAAIADAATHAKGLSAKRAMPLKVPVDFMSAAGLALGIGFLFLVEVDHTVEHRSATSGIVPVVLHEDDLDAYESRLRDLLDDPETPDDVREAAREFNRLIEDLADERLDRAESMRRIEDLERRLEETRPADAELMRESLEQLGEDLRRTSLADELSQALRDADAERAEAEMSRLAERLRQEEPNRAELERLRRALQRAAENQPEDQSEELRRLEDEMEQLLRRRQEQTEEQRQQERSLLERRRRELERLRRENREAMSRRRQLERLQREMNRSAESLQNRQPSSAADSLDRGAEDLNRMAQQQMSEQEIQQLQRQLEELRELIRRQREQQGQNGQPPRQGQGQQGQSRMDRFVLRARGQGGGQNARLRMPGQGQQGQGQQGQGQEGQGEGQQGQQGQSGQGQSGQGQGGEGEGENGQNGQPVLTLGGDGESNAILEIPGMGEQQQGQGEGSGQPSMGPGAGTGHDPTILDDPTRLGGTRRNVRIEGQHGAGPSRSEVILGSSQRGFANRDYEDVYTDYSGHAEEVLERDEVPPGYRFYVRRYFQLIRPRQ